MKLPETSKLKGHHDFIHTIKGFFEEYPKHLSFQFEKKKKDSRIRRKEWGFSKISEKEGSIPDIKSRKFPEQ